MTFLLVCFLVVWFDDYGSLNLCYHYINLLFHHCLNEMRQNGIVIFVARDMICQVGLRNFRPMHLCFCPVASFSMYLLSVPVVWEHLWLWEASIHWGCLYVLLGLLWPFLIIFEILHISLLPFVLVAICHSVAASSLRLSLHFRLTDNIFLLS